MATLDYIFEEITHKTTKLLDSNSEMKEFGEDDPDLLKFISKIYIFILT